MSTLEMTTSEKISLLCKRRGLTLTMLAEKTGQTRQNLSNKMKRNNFSESEMKAIAAALGCTYMGLLRMDDTGEVV